MSQDASDVQTDEDCEELAEEDFSLQVDISEKKTWRKKSCGKPSHSPRSPYLSSLTLNSRRTAVRAWRLPRSSLGDTRGDAPGTAAPGHCTSLSNGYGYFLGGCDHRDKEDMHDEIIHLKKSLQAQNSDKLQMKAKLRRLEEDITKREKQIEELLDPTKGSEFTRSLVDKKREGSVVLNGLKQRILKLEQQCREKENALCKLQSELRTTNLEELKNKAKTYSEEIQRLQMLLETAEKSRAESKCSQRQQKALNFTVHRLSEDLKQLQHENAALKEELNTDSLAPGLKGYREWSKQRILRRLLEVEKRLEKSRRHAQSAELSSRLDQEIQIPLAENPTFTMATEARVSVGTITEEWEAIADLKERLNQSERKRKEMEETLAIKEDELTQLKAKQEELQKEAELWKAEQKSLLEKEKEQHKRDLELLLVKIQTLEEDRSKLAQAAHSCPPPTAANSQAEVESCRAGQEEGKQRDTGCKTEGSEKDEKLSTNAKIKEEAAAVIQANWRRHKQRDAVMLQSALRGHLMRAAQLKNLLRDNSKAGRERNHEADSVTVIQAAFKGHLARTLAMKSPGPAVPSSAETKARADFSRPVKPVLKDLQPAAAFDHDPPTDSDDSDDIIVSPSRPMRSRNVLMT
ncbi:IQ domain-containing protein E [Oryzias melastigma]|uniref:IQ motif containing E n=1 Tax=Oryzias melastigma TaxID=30732 RepID=A0A3B3CM79_ORYME|nr:IQ domain-containing protein E [Oryzias melastigma]